MDVSWLYTLFFVLAGGSTITIVIVYFRRRRVIPTDKAEEEEFPGILSSAENSSHSYHISFPRRPFAGSRSLSGIRKFLRVRSDKPKKYRKVQKRRVQI